MMAKQEKQKNSRTAKISKDHAKRLEVLETRMRQLQLQYSREQEEQQEILKAYVKGGEVVQGGDLTKCELRIVNTQTE
jgi:hypothetical protein